MKHYNKITKKLARKQTRGEKSTLSKTDGMEREKKLERRRDRECTKEEANAA